MEADDKKEQIMHPLGSIVNSSAVKKSSEPTTLNSKNTSLRSAEELKMKFGRDVPILPVYAG